MTVVLTTRIVHDVKSTVIENQRTEFPVIVEENIKISFRIFHT